MLLTADEVAALTGRQRSDAQLRWLRSHGWAHEIGADGRPKVSRAYAERRLGGVDSAAKEPRLRLAHGR